MAAPGNHLDTILHGDCIAGMNALPAGSVDLAFADPPFNIGYEYDVYDDHKERDHYLTWSRDWIAAVHRVLKDDGTFWLAIGDEYAAELKIASQDVGFHCRSWVVWYYTFGVNCKYKFSRSHAHVFYFVKNPELFTFLDQEYRIPSARQLVYNDKRANPKGRLPDDTWIIPPADASGELTADEEDWGTPADTQRTYYLRPQDLEGRFSPIEDTWYFPRVAGTFKERAGFHGCQMPEQLLGRIIRLCSHEDELVFDPFSGSATTLAVAKKLNRRYLGCDLSEEYVKHGLSRLESVQVGDLLEGSAEPLLSARKTGESPQEHEQKVKARAASKTKAAEKQETASKKEASKKATTKKATTKKVGARAGKSLFHEQDADDEPVVTSTSRKALLNVPVATGFEPLAQSAPAIATRDDLNAGLIDAFARTCDGYSADRVVADPTLNAHFLDTCRKNGLPGTPVQWNSLLFSLRKRGALSLFPATRTTQLSQQHADEFLFVSEIALRQMLNRDDVHSVDQLLCDPSLAAAFDEAAGQFAPAADCFEVRWGALRLRKDARLARNRADKLPDVDVPKKEIEIDRAASDSVPEQPGVYLVKGEKSEPLYAGFTLNLKTRFERQFGSEVQLQNWQSRSPKLAVAVLPLDCASSELCGYQCLLARKHQPLLNYSDLWA